MSKNFDFLLQIIFLSKNCYFSCHYLTFQPTILTYLFIVMMRIPNFWLFIILTFLLFVSKFWLNSQFGLFFLQLMTLYFEILTSYLIVLTLSKKKWLFNPKYVSFCLKVLTSYLIILTSNLIISILRLWHWNNTSSPVQRLIFNINYQQNELRKTQTFGGIYKILPAIIQKENFSRLKRTFSHHSQQASSKLGWSLLSRSQI